MTSSRPVASILIADDDDTLRAALVELVESEPSLRLAGAASNAEEAIALAVHHQPDLALMDVRMPEGGGIRATREIRRLSPRTQVVAHSAFSDRDTVFQMLAAGAVGYLVKGASAEEILNALARAADGTATIASAVAGDVLGEIAGQIARERDESLVRAAQLDRLRRVLRSDGFHLVFQPIRELATGRIAGVEALSRFTLEPRRGPLEWFAEAEANGLRVDLELLAMRTALSTAAGTDDFFVAVNLSPGTLLSDAFHAALPRRMDRVVVEITENAAVEDYDVMATALDDVRERGAKIAIDDVGAGYATLRHILRLEPSYIKLDMELTRHIAGDRRVRALAVGLAKFAEEIDATIVAEGIETEEEREAMARVGVTYGQGYHLGRPGGFMDVLGSPQAMPR